jgi:predicted nuclease of predicted toxin-antitoxin system
VKFLVDAQLPPALARLIDAAGHEAEHVADAGLRDASDAAIWSHAQTTGAIVLTKDEDFAARSLRGGAGPVVVWLRVGNTSRAALLRWFMPLLPQVVSLIEAGERLVEVR